MNRWGVASFYLKDHGKRDGSSLEVWAKEILGNEKPVSETSTITLVWMPRIFGYGFNPVSFWLCRDSQDQLRAVISEVNNTFCETHQMTESRINSASSISDITFGKFTAVNLMTFSNGTMRLPRKMTSKLMPLLKKHMKPLLLM